MLAAGQVPGTATVQAHFSIPVLTWKASPSPRVACLLISLCLSLLTISSSTSPSPLISLVLPVSGSTTLLITLCLASHSSFVIGFIAWIRDFCSSVKTGPESASGSFCHSSSEGPGSASLTPLSSLTLSFDFFFNFFFIFFFFFLSLCFPRFLLLCCFALVSLSLEEVEEEDDEEREEDDLSEDEAFAFLFFFFLPSFFLPSLAAAELSRCRGPGEAALLLAPPFSRPLPEGLRLLLRDRFRDRPRAMVRRGRCPRASPPAPSAAPCRRYTAPELTSGSPAHFRSATTRRRPGTALHSVVPGFGGTNSEVLPEPLKARGCGRRPSGCRSPQ